MTSAIETMKTLTYGVEIETVGAPVAVLLAAIATATGGTVDSGLYTAGVTLADGRKWTVVPDGSLRNSPLSIRGSGEVVSPILTWADMGSLQAIIRALRAAGAKVDEACGLHIHVGGIREPKAVANLIKLMSHSHEELLMKSAKVAAARAARCCKPVEAGLAEKVAGVSTRAELSKAWYGTEMLVPSRYDDSRYHGLNVNSWFFRKTVEFRYFNGTLHAGEVRAFVEFCLACCAKAMTTKAVHGKKLTLNMEYEKTLMQKHLYRLGLTGPEFETCRLHMLKNLRDTYAGAPVQAPREITAA